MDVSVDAERILIFPILRPSLNLFASDYTHKLPLLSVYLCDKWETIPMERFYILELHVQLASLSRSVR